MTLLYYKAGVYGKGMEIYRIVSLVILSRVHALKHLKPFFNIVVRVCFKGSVGGTWGKWYWMVTSSVPVALLRQVVTNEGILLLNHSPECAGNIRTANN